MDRLLRTGLMIYLAAEELLPFRPGQVTADYRACRIFQLADLCAPQSYRTVVTTSHQVASIRAEQHILDSAFVPAQFHRVNDRIGQIPQPYSFVVARGGCQMPIRAKCHSLNSAILPTQIDRGGRGVVRVP